MKDSVVIGWGYVGQATAYSLGIEKHYSRSDANVKKDDLHKYRYVFICLPTPPLSDGRCDTSLVEEYISEISKKGKGNIFIIRSTVEPTTTRTLSEKYGASIVHVPEFLTEATWRQDAEWPDILVIGGDNEAVMEVSGIYHGRYKGSEFIVTDSVTAETIKYAINSFYALKVVFANQIYDYCQRMGLNYETVKSAMYARKWMSTNHFDVWHKGHRGAGGKCLKKDLEAFAIASELDLLKLVNVLNKIYLKNGTK